MDDIDILLATLKYDKLLISKLYQDDIIPQHIELAIRIIEIMFNEGDEDGNL